MQAWRMRALLVAIIVLLPFEVVLLVALWPYLDIVGKAFAGFLTTLCICGAVLAVAFSWNQVGIWTAKRRRAVLHSRLIDASGVVVLAQTDGTLAHLSAEHEAAKLALPAPVRVPEDHRSTEETVLEYHKRGIGFKKIADSTGWTEYQVRKLCNNYDGNSM